MGTYFHLTDVPPLLWLVLLLPVVLLLTHGVCRYKFWLVALGYAALVGAVIVGFLGAAGVEANSIVYPVERQTTMALVKTDGGQGASGPGFYQQVGAPTTGTAFTVKNPDGSYQQIISKRVKVFEDATGDPYVVKQQAVYTHKDVYTPGKTPLCLKDVDSGCRVNGVLNTMNPDDDAYELHVPVGSVKTAQ